MNHPLRYRLHSLFAEVMHQAQVLQNSFPAQLLLSHSTHTSSARLHTDHCTCLFAAALFEHTSYFQFLQQWRLTERSTSPTVNKDQQLGWRWSPTATGPDNGSGPGEHTVPKKKLPISKLQPASHKYTQAQRRAIIQSDLHRC